PPLGSAVTLKLRIERYRASCSSTASAAAATCEGFFAPAFFGVLAAVFLVPAMPLLHPLDAQALMRTSPFPSASPAPCLSFPPPLLLPASPRPRASSCPLPQLPRLRLRSCAAHPSG